MPDDRIVQPGDRLPSLTLQARQDERWAPVRTDDLLRGRTVVLFGLPGAFTPTCSSAHVPRYEELYDDLRRAGVDEVYCTAVNDAFGMDAWRRDQGVERVQFLPDGNGELARALGLLVDRSDVGFGPRSRRYSLLVRDGVVDQVFVEPDKPGDPYEVSDADTMLAHLGGECAPDVLLFTRPGCSHCARAKRALSEAGLHWIELPATPGTLRALPGPETTPQVYVDGALLGGADELVAWLAAR
ncbi:MAG: glutathione peroxidase [Myxococcota bacterium]